MVQDLLVKICQFICRLCASRDLEQMAERMCLMANLFNSLKKSVEACVGESPESATKYHSVGYHAKIITSIECSNRHNLSGQKMSTNGQHVWRERDREIKWHNVPASPKG